MNTIDYYLRQIDYYRKMLINNLRDLGIECEDDETYNTLIPKIYGLSASGGVTLYDYCLTNYGGTEEEVEEIVNNITCVGKPTTFRDKFKNCVNLRFLPLYKWDTSSVDSVGYMTEGVPAPLVIDMHGCDLRRVSGFSSSSAITGTSQQTEQVTKLIVTNSKHTLLGFFSFVKGQKLLTDIEGYDTIEWEVPTGNSVNMQYCLWYIYADIDLTPPLATLEGKTVGVGSIGDITSISPGITKPIILPKCYIDMSTGNTYFDFAGFDNCKHLDLSQIEYINITEGKYATLDCSCGVGFIGDEEQESEVTLKIPGNYKDVVFESFNLSRTPNVSQDLIKDMKFRFLNSLSLAGTRFRELDFNNFIFVNKKAQSGNFNLTGNIPLLEKFILNIGIDVYVQNTSAAAAALKSCPNLTYIDLSNNNVFDIQNLFIYSDSYKGPDYLDTFLLENCNLKINSTYNVDPKGFYMISYINKLSFKNSVFDSNVLNSVRLSRLTSKSKEVDLTNVDLSELSNVGYLLSYDTLCEVLHMGDNLGKYKFTSVGDLSIYKSNLNKASILELFNKIYDLNLTYDTANGGTLISQKITISDTMINQLTPEEIAVATNKGWTVLSKS